MERFSDELQEAMDALRRCRGLCLATAMTRGLEPEFLRHGPQHLRLMLDCAAACGVAADLIAHKSQFHARFCALAAELCEVCAADCDQLGGLADCASACRDAAASCRAVARREHAEEIARGSRHPPRP